MSWTSSFWVEKRRSERESIFAIKQGCHKKTSFKNRGHKLFWKAEQLTGYWGREWWDSWIAVHHTSGRGPFDNFSLVLSLWQSLLKILLWSCASCISSVLNSGLRTIRAPHIYAVACYSTISQTIFHHHARVAPPLYSTLVRARYEVLIWAALWHLSRRNAMELWTTCLTDQLR